MKSKTYVEAFFRCFCGNEEIAVVPKDHNIVCGNCGSRMSTMEILSVWHWIHKAEGKDGKLETGAEDNS